VKLFENRPWVIDLWQVGGAIASGGVGVGKGPNQGLKNLESDSFRNEKKKSLVNRSKMGQG